MKKIMYALGFLLSFSVFADNSITPPSNDGLDNIYAQINGSCTKQTCPPGTTVIVTAKKDDTGRARSEDGHDYDLLNFKGVKFSIIKSSDGYSSEARVSSPRGDVYYIQWIFLKKL